MQNFVFTPVKQKLPKAFWHGALSKMPLALDPASAQAGTESLAEVAEATAS